MVDNLTPRARPPVALHIAPDAALLFGPVSFPLTEGAVLTHHGRALPRPYRGILLHDGDMHYYALALTGLHLPIAHHGLVKGLTITYAHGEHRPIPPHYLLASGEAITKEIDSFSHDVAGQALCWIAQQTVAIAEGLKASGTHAVPPAELTATYRWMKGIFHSPLRAPITALAPEEQAQLRENIGRLAWLHEDFEAVIALQHALHIPPRSITEGESAFNMHIEQAIPLATRGVCISGWMRDPLQHVQRLTWVTPWGARYDMRPTLHRLPRPDIAEGYQHTPYGEIREPQGFICTLHFADAPPIPSLTGRVEAELTSGAIHPILPPFRYYDAITARAALLQLYPLAQLRTDTITQAIAPAISALDAAITAYPCALQVTTIGAAYGAQGTAENHRPLASDKKISASCDIVSWISANTTPAHIQAHLASYALAPSASGAFSTAALAPYQLCYVVSETADIAALERQFTALSALYQQPITLAIAPAHAGKAQALQHFAEHYCNSSFLFFTTPHLLPQDGNWLQKAIASYSTQRSNWKKIGALSPLVSYEDRSIHYAGGRLQPLKEGGFKLANPFRGYPMGYADAQHPNATDALLFEALLITRSAWNAAGGLPMHYAEEECTAPELTMRLREAGYAPLYNPTYMLTRLCAHTSTNALRFPHSAALTCDWMYFNTRWAGKINAMLSGDGIGLSVSLSASSSAKTAHSKTSRTRNSAPSATHNATQKRARYKRQNLA